MTAQIGGSATAELPVQGRTSSERGKPTKIVSPEQLRQRIAQAVSMQSGVLNTMAHRLLAMESQIAKVGDDTLVSGLPQVRHGVISKIQPDQIPGQDAVISLLALDSTIENISLGELCLLMQLMHAGQARDVFEIGTADGRTTLNLAANCAVDGKVFTLNLPRNDAGRRFQSSPFRTKIQQLFGDTATFDFSPYFNSVDFVFIDANHDYEFVLSDTLAALKLLRNGRGTIVWHDYISHWGGVVRALDYLLKVNPSLAGMLHIDMTSLVYARVGL